MTSGTERPRVLTETDGDVWRITLDRPEAGNALDPAMFVLGGGLAEGADLYLDPIERWFDALLYSPQLRPHPVLAFATLGERAGAIGAALAAAERQRAA